MFSGFASKLAPVALLGLTVFGCEAGARASRGPAAPSYLAVEEGAYSGELTADTAAVERLREMVQPITGAATDFDPILALASDARHVLLGEASHGTEEFYRARAAISRRLIEEQGFDALVLEADWPAVARVDRYIRGEGEDASAVEALAGFHRFPRWMWRNQAFAELVEELREHNRGLAPHEQVRVFGMDVYSPLESAGEVVDFLAEHDPKAARSARETYDRCLGAMSLGAGPSAPACPESVAGLVETVAAHAGKPGAASALQNAKIARNAEIYERLAAQDSAASWNHRDRHMLATLESVEAQLEAEREEVGLVVWAHNSHLGDARATEMSRRGKLNLGQLARETWGEEVVNVGFTTHGGEVRAAPSWGAPERVHQVRPGRPDSVEGLFHSLGVPAFVLLLEPEGLAEAVPPLLERAIGVIYRPQTERWSHYFEADLTEQFDAVIHFDTTTALEPLADDARA